MLNGGTQIGPDATKTGVIDAKLTPPNALIINPFHASLTNPTGFTLREV